MRRWTMPAALLAAGAVLLGGCGSGRGPIIDGDPVPQPVRHLPFGERAALVLRDWQDSGAERLWGSGLDRRWFTGLVLLNWTLTQEYQASSGMSVPCDDSCYQIVGYRLGVPLPARPAPEGIVTFLGGATPLRAPLISAAAAFGALPRGSTDDCAAAWDACLTVTVTSVTLGAVRVPASRGLATVPAWEFSFMREGIPDDFDQIAAAPATVVTLPDALITPPPDKQYAAIAAVTPDPRDPRRLTVRLRLAPGAGHPQLDVAQTAGEIVVGALVTPSRAGSVPDYQATVTLAAPLGQRVVLDAATGLPVR